MQQDNEGGGDLGHFALFKSISTFKSRADIRFPRSAKVPALTQQLVTALLVPDPSKRLGKSWHLTPNK
eukprot:4738603-Pyramimonas_sp.AAC.1